MSHPSLPSQQLAIVASADGALVISDAAPVPELEDDMIIIETTAVALNPIDLKMQGQKATSGCLAGADFAGTVVAVGGAVESAVQFKPGDRICGAVQSMHSLTPKVGAFARFVGATGHVCLRIPDHLSDEQGASLGIGLPTIGLALFQSLRIPGYPGAPASKPQSILIYGGSSSVGTLAIQIAKLSGMTVLTTCSPRNFDLVKSYGADHVFDYNQGDASISEIKALTKNSLKFVLDCISELDTMEYCYRCLGRTGGRYTRLEPYPEFLHTRPTVTPDWVLGPTVLGKAIAWPAPFERDGDAETKAFALRWYATAQELVDSGQLRPHPLKVMDNGLNGVLEGLDLLKSMSGQKLVVRMNWES